MSLGPAQHSCPDATQNLVVVGPVVVVVVVVVVVEVVVVEVVVVGFEVQAPLTQLAGDAQDPR